MATSKKKTKTTRARPAKKPAGKKGRKTEMLVTSNALVLPLDKVRKAAIERCLKRSGQVTLTFTEVGTTKLPDLDAIATVPITD